jgi:hypothetical protein
MLVVPYPADVAVLRRQLDRLFRRRSELSDVG